MHGEANKKRHKSLANSVAHSHARLEPGTLRQLVRRYNIRRRIKLAISRQEAVLDAPALSYLPIEASVVTLLTEGTAYIGLRVALPIFAVQMLPRMP